MAQTIITTAAVIAAAIAIMGYYNKIHDWIKHQAEQDERMGQLGANHTVPVAKDKLDKYINKQAHQQEV